MDVPSTKLKCLLEEELYSYHVIMYPGFGSMISKPWNQDNGMDKHKCNPGDDHLWYLPDLGKQADR